MYGPHFLGHGTVNEPSEADSHPAWSAAYAWDCGIAMAFTEAERERCKAGRAAALAAYHAR